MHAPTLANGWSDTSRKHPPTSLYVHIPFCASRCYYCDFTTSVALKAIEPYVADLDREFALLAAEPTKPLQTVFFGGGTPTLLTARQLEATLDNLQKHFTIAADAEITMEANPGTLDAEKLAVLRAGGVNRLSFGAQTFSDRLLMTIGRSHDEPAIIQSVRAAQQAGFDHINVDLMFGLPEQSLADVSESLGKLLALDVAHVSAYWLKVEQGTPFAVWHKRGQLPLPGEDLEADMYDFVRETMVKHGFLHYEVSNFARPGHKALHNLVYWHNEPYLAAGVGAHGYVGGIRYENVKGIKNYQALLQRGIRPYAMQHLVDATESCEDTMMLGLRLSEGVSRERFLRQHGRHLEEVFGPVVDRLEKRGLLQWDGDHVRVTDRAWPIANLVYEEFVATHLLD